ncbi:hypothetical protein CC78DRAFT_92926 [Lojkania enalia]|uniref:Uncharacterized protein n=1 Tax=Lojkania enalia TaxID=147567 RepID=A0A9P4N5L2_9PLEO|nr:hypothetical protein CC78DRAFT_92926 [Didymosphaeria enalia]
MSTAQPSHLSQPILFYLDDLKANLDLVAQIISLANTAFWRSKKNSPEQWEVVECMRFQSPEDLFRMVGIAGVMAIICVVEDGSAKAGNKWKNENKVVGCATAVPWDKADGLWPVDKRNGVEEGWEIKAVCVDGDVRFAKQGLAINMLQTLQDWAIQKEIEIARMNGKIGDDGNRVARFWIQAAECLNGEYWRKRGYTEVRKAVQGHRLWDCKTNFELVVLVKEVVFRVNT